MPILVLSARHAEEEKVQLLTVGADDYVTKPFSIPEFAARVRALLRRARTPNPMTHAVLQTSDGLTIDFARRTLVRDGETIRLTPLDNSFLIEEAYNQEAGVVQHISSWQRSLRSSAWAFTFTQEWPLGGRTHQLSYTIPVQRTESPANTGVGDIVLNYRHQLRPASARVAIAPRLSMILPTGSAPRGLGTGHVGAQLNLPVSVRLAAVLVSHWNAGVTVGAQTPTYNLGASMIWLARPTFNAMVEVTWLEQGRARDFVVSPGIRWAHNLASGLQIVPGLAFPGGKSALFYLSFEHRFKPADSP